MNKTILFVLAYSLLSGCTAFQPKIPLTDVEINPHLARLASCEQFYLSLDRFSRSENIQDSQTKAIPGTLFLNVDRFWHSFKPELDTLEKKDFWIFQTAKLNQKARMVQWHNLSESAKSTVRKKHLRSTSANQRIQSCSQEHLKQLTLADKNRVINLADTHDDYSLTMRSLGIYPLSSLIVTRQIKKHLQSTRKTFNTPLHRLPIKHKLQRYTPNKFRFSDNYSVERENPLNVPFLSTTTLDQLFNQFAPVLEVDEANNSDKIGQVFLDQNGKPAVDIHHPVIYTLPSYTRFNDKVYLQLNYFFWFPERPKEKSFDIYAGKFDGIIWRVTLDENLSPILFDTVHNCGCYHKLYATDKLKFKLEEASIEKEPPFLAQNKLTYENQKPWVLRINSVNHFVERIYQDNKFDKNAKSYDVKSYHDLRQLTQLGKPTGKSRSFFNNKGIVSESKRPERFILWPMGVPSAGAMRQWGHHAIAFVGRRYFDEPFLLDKYFMFSD